MCRSTTSPAAGYRHCSMVWRWRRTGCRQLVFWFSPGDCICSGSMFWVTSSVGLAAFVSWRYWWRPTSTNSASTCCRIFSSRVTAGVQKKYGAFGCYHCHRHRIVHRRRSSDLCDRPDRIPVSRHRFLSRHLSRSCQHSRLLLHGRNACSYLYLGSTLDHYADCLL